MDTSCKCLDALHVYGATNGAYEAGRPRPGFTVCVAKNVGRELVNGGKKRRAALK